MLNSVTNVAFFDLFTFLLKYVMVIQLESDD